jgi:hypothetical protein
VFFPDIFSSERVRGCLQGGNPFDVGRQIPSNYFGLYRILNENQVSFNFFQKNKSKTTYLLTFSYLWLMKQFFSWRWWLFPDPTGSGRVVHVMK